MMYRKTTKFYIVNYKSKVESEPQKGPSAAECGRDCGSPGLHPSRTECSFCFFKKAIAAGLRQSEARFDV